MKQALVVFIVLFLSILTSAKDTSCSGHTNMCRLNDATRAISRQLKRKASPKAVPPAILAPVILRAALRYGIDYHLLTAVILVESGGVRTAYNKRSRDYGLGQINIHTARSLGLSMQCLYSIDCNVNATAKILSELKDGRLCRFNVGTRKLVSNRLYICQKYERKIAGAY